MRFLLTRLADDIDLLSCRVHALRSPDPEVRLEAALGLETPEADAILRDLVQNGWTAKERDVVETFPDLHVLSKDALRAVEVLDDKPAVAAGGKPHVPLKTRVRRSRELTTIKAAAKALNSRLSRAEFVDLLTAAIPPDGQSAAEHPDIEWYRRARRRLTIGLLWVWRERPWPPENPHIDRLRTVAEALLRETHLESELTRDALRLMECVDRSRAATLAMGLMDRGECVEVAASTLGRVGDERAVPSLTAAKKTLPPLDFNAHLAVEHALGEIRGRIHGRPVGSLAVVADPSGEGQLSIAPSPGADPDA